MVYVFEYKTQWILIHAPYTHIVVFYHISNISLIISSNHICCETHQVLYSSNIC